MDNDYTSEVDHSSYQQDDQQTQNQGDSSVQDQIQYVQSGLEMASSAADIASAFQPQQQQQQPPPQYQPRPPPQPLGGGQPQQPNFQQQPAAYPPQPQPPQAPRPMQYLAPQPPQQQNQNYQNQPPQQQYPPQSPQFQKPQQQSPFQQQPPQQYPPQNMQNNNNSPMYANASNQNHPFGQPPPSPVKTYPPSKQYQTPPVQVGYNKPVYPPAQQQMQQQQQQQQQPQTYYSPAPAPAPAQGVPMQAPYGPQGTPMNPSMMQLQNMGTEPWSSGLFDFMQDPNNALITLFVPCLTFGQIAEVVDNGTTTCGTSALLYGLVAAFIGVPFIMSCTYRTKIRSKYGLVETPAPDWVTHLFCEPCALCQEYRELQYRGLDPSIGWQGNMAKAMQQQQPNMMNPPTNQMMR